MQTNVQKWGNSLGVRIPSRIAKQLHLTDGSPVNMDIEDGRLIIQSPKYSLDTMLDAITHENQHHNLLDDTVKGEEEWL
jgi:antitoxin MazE